MKLYHRIVVPVEDTNSLKAHIINTLSHLLKTLDLLT